jgi:hypothetical protein
MSTTVARKEHRCQLCGGMIQPGESYDCYQCTPWDGINDSFAQWRAHQKCYAYTWKRIDLNLDEGIHEEDLWTLLQEELSEDRYVEVKEAHLQSKRCVMDLVNDR